MRKLRFITALLATNLVFGVFGSLSILPVYAAEEKDKKEEETIDYMTTVYKTPEEKLATMTKKVENDGYELYIEPYTAEIAVKDKATGQIIFSNPFDVGSSKTTSDDKKAELLSQVEITYMDNDKELKFQSFTESAKRNQIVVKNIKNGIRVEYTLGREEKRKLVPKMIEKARFEELILDNIDNPAAIKKMLAFYQLKDPNDAKLTERGKKELQATFPITKSMAIYVFDPYASDRELNQIEAYIKQYCPNYTYETLDEDHAMTEYTGVDKAPALFKLSLEYYLDDQGFYVRLPSNGIRFDESQYKLTNVVVLPYIGAGSSDFKGYTFIPDGGGTITRFEDIAKGMRLTGKLYGQDFAFHKVGGAHQEVMRLPVYGVVENYVGKETITSSVEVEGYTDAYGDYIEPETKEVTETKEIKEDRGFLAIIEEGDALAEISTNHGGVLHKYHNVFSTFSPRSRDSYNLSEAISVGANAMVSVESKRKYVGNYKVRFIMLSDPDVAKENKVSEFYEASYVGMAKAYREYLEKKGVLNKIQETEANIPLYIESFGTIKTSQKILSIPFDVDTPLTTFDNLKTMYTQLKDKGIDNINFRLRGFTNNGYGGMIPTMPYNVKFDSKVGGNNGFKDFMSFANTNKIGVFPEFDFANVSDDKTFDGFSVKKHAVKTIDNRYSPKREYDPVFQMFYRGGFNLTVAPSTYEYFYNEFNKNYTNLAPNGLSVSTLGTDLNSDFDKKDPYNREDSKESTTDVLSRMKEDYGNIMVDAGNAYTLPYVNHILNVSLDSSRYLNSSEAVPFMGMVLHGYKNFAGTPINMAGDVNYVILKAIENGASPYFMLSYQNTAELKDWDSFAKYFSVGYDIWFDDLVRDYSILNEALKDVQTSTIDGHEFLIGERVAAPEEIASDKAEEDKIAKEKAEVKALKEEKAAKKKILESRLAGETPVEPEAEEDTETEKDEEAEEDDGEYKYTKYTVDNGRIVKVTYANGKTFILNYNNFAVSVEGKTIDALGFVVVK